LLLLNSLRTLFQHESQVKLQFLCLVLIEDLIASA